MNFYIRQLEVLRGTLRYSIPVLYLFDSQSALPPFQNSYPFYKVKLDVFVTQTQYEDSIFQSENIMVGRWQTHNSKILALYLLMRPPRLSPSTPPLPPPQPTLSAPQSHNPTRPFLVVCPQYYRHYLVAIERNWAHRNIRY
jgi:hypothetical protein